MKDNFDLKKFLTENKVFEEFNPYTSEGYKSEPDNMEEEKSTPSLRDRIKEMILAELSLQEVELDEAKKDKDEEEVEDVEVEDTEEFEPEMDMDSEMDTEPDLDSGEKEIMDSLETALDFAKQKGDEKLIDQIGNTITFFTRQYIVK